MDQLFKDLSYSQLEDSSWVSKLNVNLPTPPQLKLGNRESPNDIKQNYNSEITTQSTNIIPVLVKPSTVNQSIMKDLLKYPKGYLLCFEGCTSFKIMTNSRIISVIVH